MAIDTIGDALASGGSVYEADPDAVLVGEALPFSLKLLDSLVAESPRHRGLLVAGSRAYLLYAYGYVGSEADRIARDDVDRAGAVRARTRNLALRSHRYAMRGLELRHAGIAAAVAADPVTAARAVTDARDVDLLYLAAASLAVAIGSGKDDASMLVRLPEVDALLARALALDEAWNDGALHELAVSWQAARPGVGDRRAIDAHYERALALSRGTRATLFVAYAEAVAVRAQDRKLFDGLVARALAVDPEARPDERLQDALAKQRARWLAGLADQLFLE
ncbi:MAG: TRAP transporter TatT component family protein [Betaproteobacteria bacterium]|nr:TRAP transporter TatT component family protein [Betaproteobacteria bacterium]